MMNNVETNMTQIMEIFLAGILWNSLSSASAIQEWGRKFCQGGRCGMHLSIINDLENYMNDTLTKYKQYQYQSKQFTFN